MSEVVVIGAGISGLTAAWQLRAAGHSVTVLERQDRVGGAIDSEWVEGAAGGRFLLEWGPNSALASARMLLRLAQEVDATLATGSTAAQSRYIVRGGALRRLPRGPFSALTSSALSLRGKWRALREPWQSRGGDCNEDAARFFARRFGAEVADYLVAPFVSGIYGGLAAELEMSSAFPKVFGWERDAGSVVRGAWRHARARRAQRKRDARSATATPAPVRGTFSFADGMAELPRKLSAALADAVVLNCEVTEIVQRGRGWTVRTLSGDRDAEHVIVTLPAYAAAPLLAAPAVPEALAEALAAIPYAPISILQLAFERAQLPRPLDGFGFLVPPCERAADESLLGCIWASAVFPHRAPAGHELLTLFAGGRGHPDPSGIVDAALVTELSQVLGALPTPLVQARRDLPRAIPQYVVGHGERIAAIQRSVAERPGLHLAGNYLDGISIEAAAISGAQVVERIASART